jgi:hypothetical protein
VAPSKRRRRAPFTSDEQRAARLRTVVKVMRTIAPGFARALDDLCMLEIPTPFSLDGLEPRVAFYFGQLEAARLRIVEHWAPHWERERNAKRDQK